MHTLARVPAREFEPDREPAGPVGVRRALTWPLRLALGLLISVALWALLAVAARAADDVAPTGQPADATSTTDPQPPEPPPDGAAVVDPVTEPVDETTAPPPDDSTQPPADDGTQPPPSEPPAEEPPPPADGGSGLGTDGAGPVDCPVAGGDSSACPASEPAPPTQPDSGPVTDPPAEQPVPEEPTGQDPSVPPEPVVDQPPPVEQPADEVVPEVVPEAVPEVVPEDVPPVVEPEVVEEAVLEPEVVPPPADVCTSSGDDPAITSIGDLASPAVACGDVLPPVALPVVPDPAVEVADGADSYVPPWLPTLNSASSEPAPVAAPVAADEPIPTLSATVPGHVPYPTQRPLSGAPAPMPAAPPAPTASGSGSGCGGPGLRRDGADRPVDQVGVVTDPADLGEPTDAEQACTSSPADAVLAREADPRLRPD